MKLTRNVLNYPIEITTEAMGKDISVQIKGGMTFHIGAVSLIGPDSPLQTLALPHHKDQVITEMYAKALYKQFHCAVAVTCGIHYDQATSDDLQVIITNTKEMLAELIAGLRRKNTMSIKPFSEESYEVKTLTLHDQTITYRAYENIIYVQKPIEPDYQCLNIFVPECFYHNQSINGYRLHTAPIFMPNTVGGYMPGKPAVPKEDRHGELNAVFKALQHGYVVVSAGSRGRKLQDEQGHYTGIAPACIVDQKAAIRYLRHNEADIPGDLNKIISNGTSAGGALSSLMGATGNSPLYEPYLEAIGAYHEKDNIFASSCYCPITNLENADKAYEWSFNGINEFQGAVPVKDENGNIRFEKRTAQLTEEQIQASNELKQAFIDYLNSLKLTANGQLLTLDKNGDGSFKQYIQSLWIQSANRSLAQGNDLSSYEFITWEDGQVKDIDFDQYMQFSTRMKAVPAFDTFNLRSPENQLFGTETTESQHFTLYSYQHSHFKGALAAKDIIALMNPLNFIHDQSADTAKHWRIRHGAIDRDTSLAIPAILALSLENAGYHVDFFSPWQIPHAGDYDLDELFAWIDEIAK